MVLTRLQEPHGHDGRGSLGPPELARYSVLLPKASLHDRGDLTVSRDAADFRKELAAATCVEPKRGEHPSLEAPNGVSFGEEVVG